MSDFDDPAARLVAFDASLSFFPAGSDMWNVASFTDSLIGWLPGEGRIGAKIFCSFSIWLGSRNDHRVENRDELRHIMSIRPGDDERDRDATGVHQQHALAPIFSPDPSGWVRQIPVPRVLS